MFLIINGLFKKILGFKTLIFYFYTNVKNMEQIKATICKMDDFLGAIEAERFVSPERAAALSGWSIQTIYNYIHLGKLPKHKRGKNLLIGVNDLANVVFNQN